MNLTINDIVELIEFELECTPLKFDNTVPLYLRRPCWKRQERTDTARREMGLNQDMACTTKPH